MEATSGRRSPAVLEQLRRTWNFYRDAVRLLLD